VRYFIELAYDGTNYHGWQAQKNALAVQPVIEAAMSTLLKHDTLLTGSGRTDAGVHAQMQVGHFDCAEKIEQNDLAYKLNALLPKEIAIKNIRPVKPDAHARFSAVRRDYEYRFVFQKDPFNFRHSVQIPSNLDFEKMNAAAAVLPDYSSFRSFSTAKTDLRDFSCIINTASWHLKTNSAVLEISANRFLRGMVRAITGTLLEVGKGRITVEELKKIIDKKDRKAAAATAPAHGLHLTGVHYPEEIYL